MSNDNSVDKDRLYFTQCNEPIQLRCPECTSIKKVLRQCKIFHNFPSLWWHLKQDHPDIFQSRREEIIKVLNSMFLAYKWNMFPKWSYSEETTTSSSIVFQGRQTREDFVKRLKEIVYTLKTQSIFYPNFKQKHIQLFIEKAIGMHDPRTMKKYYDCILNYSRKDTINGVYDVSGFCGKVGL